MKCIAFVFSPPSAEEARFVFRVALHVTCYMCAGTAMEAQVALLIIVSILQSYRHIALAKITHLVTASLLVGVSEVVPISETGGFFVLPFVVIFVDLRLRFLWFHHTTIS